MLSKLSAERIQYVFLNTDDAICATRKDGEVIYANPAAEKLFGIGKQEAKKLWDIIPLIPENDALIQLFIDKILIKKDSFRALVDYVNSENERFCLHVSLTQEAGEDGIFLIVASDMTQLVKVHSAFERYTSPDIADYVLTAPSGEKQGGTDREVSILMSDIRGFTMMSTAMSSGDLVTMLNHYFEQMSAVIDSFGGTTIEFLGDGIFVVFGAPKDLPGHARAAVACAIGMQNAMAEVNAWNREKGFPELEMGIGINSGITAVGNIGSVKKMKYGCMGEAVNMAGRLESLTIGGQIFVSENTVKMIPEGLTTVAEGSTMPKGAREPIKYYEVTGLENGPVLQHSGGDESWTDVQGDGKVTFYVLEGKNVDTIRHDGRIVRISGDGRYGIMVQDTVLNPLQNLMIRIGEHDAYAKVLEVNEKECRLRFTAKPGNLAELLNKHG